MLRGTIRDHDGGPRRAFIRFFACEQDLSHEPPDALCPTRSSRGRALSDRGGDGGRLAFITLQSARVSRQFEERGSSARSTSRACM